MLSLVLEATGICNCYMALIIYLDFSIIICHRPERFGSLLQRLHLLESSKVVSSNLTSDHLILARLSASIHRIPFLQYQLQQKSLIARLVNVGFRKPISCVKFSSHHSACWVPFDIYMESAMDGKQLNLISSVIILTGGFSQRSC